MKTKPFATLVITLIGFYSIFSGVLMSGSFITTIVMSLFSPDRAAMFGMGAFGIAPSLVAIVLGIVLIRKAAVFAARLFPADEVVADSGVNIETLRECAFSLLGLFCLINTVPGALHFAADQWLARMPSLSHVVRTQEEFFPNQLPSIVYHVSAVGFSLYVFLHGKKISGFTESLRRD